MDLRLRILTAKTYLTSIACNCNLFSQKAKIKQGESDTTLLLDNMKLETIYVDELLDDLQSRNKYFSDVIAELRISELTRLKTIEELNNEIEKLKQENQNLKELL